MNNAEKRMITDLTDEERHLELVVQVVIVLCKTLPQKMYDRLYFDNFCPLDLLIYLKRLNIDLLGTLRRNESFA